MFPKATAMRLWRSNFFHIPANIFLFSSSTLRHQMPIVAEHSNGDMSDQVPFSRNFDSPLDSRNVTSNIQTVFLFLGFLRNTYKVVFSQLVISKPPRYTGSRI